MENSINHSCENCSHFQQHYFWFHKKFIKTNCGYCLKRHISKKDNARFPFKEGCEQWETAEIKKEIIKNDIRNILNDIAITIENIALFLDENEIN